MSSQEFATINETASILQVHPNTLRARIKDGTLSAVKLNGVFRLNVAKAIAALEEKAEQEQQAAQAEAAQRTAEREARLRERQATAYADALEAKLRDQTMERCRHEKKPFPAEWDRVKAESRAEIEAKGRALDSLICQSRKEDPTAFSDRAALSDLRVPPALAKRFDSMWRAELKVGQPESIERVAPVNQDRPVRVESTAPGAHLERRGGDSSKQPKQKARKLMEPNSLAKANELLAEQGKPLCSSLKEALVALRTS